jgi:hypothetical protein
VLSLKEADGQVYLCLDKSDQEIYEPQRDEISEQFKILYDENLRDLDSP